MIPTARSPIRRLATAVAWGALLLAPSVLGAQASSDEETEAPEVTRLELRGVSGVSVEQLRESIATQASECKSLLLQTFFCWWTHSPTFFERHHLDRRELAADVVRIRIFYWRRGWRNAEVDTLVAPDGDGVRVTFDIRQGRPTVIRRLTVLYDSTMFKQRIIERLTRVRAGEPLDLIALDSSRVMLEAELWNKGYGDAVVDTSIVVDTARRIADVTLRLVPNWRTYVGSITVHGNEKVARETIENSLTLRTGDAFRRDDVLLSQRNLYESNLFRQATISTPPVRTPIKPVEIIVSEAPQREARIGVGLNTVDFVQVEGRLTHHNLLGGARRLDLTGVAGNLLAPQLNGMDPFRDVVRGFDDDEADDFLLPTWQLSADFRQPAWLQRPQNAFGVGVFSHRRAFPGVYIDRGYGGSLTLTRMVRPRAPASLTYRFELTRVSASEVFFCVNYGVCDTPTLDVVRRNQRLAPLVLSGLVDRSDEPFSPTHGYKARVDFEHASTATASTFGFNRFYTEGAVYKRVGDRRNTGTRATVLAGRLRVGLVRALSSQIAGVDSNRRILHPRTRFYAGGAQSVRGYGESQLGPRILTVAPEVLRRLGCDVNTRRGIEACNPNGASVYADPDSAVTDGDFTPRPLGGTAVLEASVEYRFPIVDKLSGAVFVDAGIVAADPEFRTQPGIEDLSRGTGAITPGFGIRYRSPVGPIRVDVGINPSISENLPVATELDVGGQQEIVQLEQLRTYSPIRGQRGFARLLSRLTLHLSIGQAF